MTARRAMILGLTGAPGVGKDTVANLLCAHDGWQRVAFADGLRVEVSTAWDVGYQTFTGLEHDKNQPHPALRADRCTNHMGVKADWLLWCHTHGHDLTTPRSPRWVMQQYATMRRAQRADHWVHPVVQAMHRVATTGVHTIVTDVRLANEAAALRQLGARLLRVHRPGATALPADTATHESEGHIALQVDGDIVNDGSLQHLHYATWSAISAAFHPTTTPTAA